MYKNLKNKKLLLLGGINHAIEIIKTAQKMGVKVYVADYNQNTQAKKLADKSFDISTTDIDLLVDLCKKENINGIITGFIDSMLPYCEELCGRLNLPFWANKDQINISINKNEFKKTCEKYNIPLAKDYSHMFHNNTFNDDDLSKIIYPVIVKPVDNSGSRGVYVCNNINELRKNYIKALEFSKSKNVIVEQYLQGQHVNMYYTLINGNIYLSAMADRYVDNLDNDSAPLPVCLIHPSRYLSDYEKDIDKRIQYMMRALEMKNGLAFFQGFRCDDGNFYIYEMGYRLNGGGTYTLINECLNYNQLEMLIHYSLTGEMCNIEAFKAQKFSEFKKHGVNYVLSVKSGDIDSIEGLDELGKMPFIKNIVQVRFPGDKITGKGGSSQVIAYILFTIDKIEDINSYLDSIYNIVKIKNSNGNNLDIIKYYF